MLDERWSLNERVADQASPWTGLMWIVAPKSTMREAAGVPPGKNEEIKTVFSTESNRMESS